MQLGQNWQTLSPEIVQLIKGNAIQSEYDTYHGALGRSLEQAGAAGNYRGGATRMAERTLASDLASSIGNINRGVDIQAALQRPQDMVTASNLLQSNIGQQYQFDRDKASVLAGAATNPVWSQPTPKAQGLGGVGSVGGAILGSGFSPGWLGV